MQVMKNSQNPIIALPTEKGEAVMTPPFLKPCSIYLKAFIHQDL
jgi:hypothetical protein